MFFLIITEKNHVLFAQTINHITPLVKPAACTRLSQSHSCVMCYHAADSHVISHMLCLLLCLHETEQHTLSQVQAVTRFMMQTV